MKNSYSIAERNRIVEAHLYCIDKVMERNHILMEKACLDKDDVYQQLAVRLIMAVTDFDPKKGRLKQHIYAQLQYEFLRCKAPQTLCGMTGLPENYRRTNMLSFEDLSTETELPCLQLTA